MHPFRLIGLRLALLPALLLAACGPAPAPQAPTPAPVSGSAVAATPEGSATPSPTIAPTQAPTETTAPTVTSLPTETPAPTATPAPTEALPTTCLDQKSIDLVVKGYLDSTEIQSLLTTNAEAVKILKEAGFTAADTDNPVARQAMVERIWHNYLQTGGSQQSKGSYDLNGTILHSAVQNGLLIGRFTAEFNGGKSNCIVMILPGAQGKPEIATGIADFLDGPGVYHGPPNTIYTSFEYTQKDIDAFIGKKVSVGFKVFSWDNESENAKQWPVLTFHPELLTDGDYTKKVTMQDLGLKVVSGQTHPIISLPVFNERVKAKMGDSFKGTIVLYWLKQ